MITVIYPLHNRLYYTQLTLPRVINECERAGKLVNQLRIYDDESTDGSFRFINSLNYRDVPNLIQRKKIGNSTFQINDSYNNCPDGTKYLIKIDNDILIPENCFKYLFDLMEKDPDLGFIMMGETGGLPFLKEPLEFNERKYIGGVGIFRKELFDKHGPIKSDGRFGGFTLFQNRLINAGKCRAIELLNVKNTNLDYSRTYSRIDEYEKKKWSRRTMGKIGSPFNH